MALFIEENIMVYVLNYLIPLFRHVKILISGAATMFLTVMIWRTKNFMKCHSFFVHCTVEMTTKWTNKNTEQLPLGLA